MNSKERMKAAMDKKVPDRVPVMCQLSIGHYLLNTNIHPSELWHSSESFAEALLTLANRYHFDGILINLPGRPFDWKSLSDKIENSETGETVYWKDGSFSFCPKDDNVQVYSKNKSTGEYSRDNLTRPDIDSIDPEKIFYENPHTIAGLKYPDFYFDIEPKNFDKDNPENWFPVHELRTIEIVKEKAQNSLSVHAEFFSPFTQLMELLGYENALIALITNTEKCIRILERFTQGCIFYGKILAKTGVDAILNSSAFAGAGFISREMYRNFVLPFEKAVWTGIKQEYPDVPCYTHTCGAIGDRLDLMVETGLDGIDTLDPPPLGTVELDKAKEYLGNKVFIKGNIDSVNTLLLGDDNTVREDIIRRIEWGKPNGGYILSTACSVAPGVKPERLSMLVELADKYGKY